MSEPITWNLIDPRSIALIPTQPLRTPDQASSASPSAAAFAGDDCLKSLLGSPAVAPTTLQIHPIPTARERRHHATATPHHRERDPALSVRWQVDGSYPASTIGAALVLLLGAWIVTTTNAAAAGLFAVAAAVAALGVTRGAQSGAMSGAIGGALVILATGHAPVVTTPAASWSSSAVLLVVAFLPLTGVLAGILAERERAGRQRLALLWRLAHEDGLTGLPNRTSFLERQEEARLQAARTGAGLALLFVDLDDFKHVNDHYGHAVGDELLRLVGQRLRASLRGGDAVARFGGDEFAVLLEGIRHSADAERVATRVQAAFASPFLVHRRRIDLHASIGVAVGGLPGTDLLDPAELLRRADDAMYAAKRSRDHHAWRRTLVFPA